MEQLENHGTKTISKITEEALHKKRTSKLKISL